jgi:hypothetical protein
MGYCLGFDGGGTKTDCVVLNADGAADLLDSVLTSGALRATISRLEISPAIGAARIAARMFASPAQAKTYEA